MLKRYPWPGNVRELKNLVERLMIMTPRRVIEVSDIPAPYNKLRAISDKGIGALLKFDSLKEAKSEFERFFIENKLREFKGNISQTAEAINVERSYLHKKIRAYGLDVAKYKGRHESHDK